MAGKKPKNPEPPAHKSAPVVRRLLVVAVTLVAVGGLVWGVAKLGEEARRGLGNRERYAVRFADIECDAPLGTDRAAFLSEVRYVSNFPESFQSLDPDLATKFTAAFAAHPWVERAEDISVNAEGRVRVQLRFRVPALAVKTADGTRVTDANGVLLPPEASADGLPALASAVPFPRSPAGQVWANPDVKRALELMAAHHPRTLEKTPQGWRLAMPDGKTLAVEK